jgi:hypothetical protein
MDTLHLQCLINHLCNEKERLKNAKTIQEKEFRSVWVRQLEKEIEQEEAFLASKGIQTYKTDPNTSAEMTDDEIFNQLFN